MRKSREDPLKQAEKLCQGKAARQITEQEFVANMSITFATHLSRKLHALGDFPLSYGDYVDFVQKIFKAIDSWAESIKRRGLKQGLLLAT